MVSYAQEPLSPCQQPAAYIGKTDVTSPLEYGPISVTAVGGRISGALVTGEPKGISRACLALFTEGKHKFVASAVTDEAGEFQFSGVPTGRYRIVVRAPGFYVEEIPVRVLKKVKQPKPIEVVLQSVVMRQQQRVG
ncbi:MAG: carboxypeptidase-like regulatory domain-containing protein [Acidobacteriota bacterium]|nr:carboxypeptidase-like regulatory domain-containing protein [Acidobacteriota bacterium]